MDAQATVDLHDQLPQVQRTKRDEALLAVEKVPGQRCRAGTAKLLTARLSSGIKGLPLAKGAMTGSSAFGRNAVGTGLKAVYTRREPGARPQSFRARDGCAVNLFERQRV